MSMRLLFLTLMGGAVLISGCAAPRDYRPPVVERTPPIEDRNVPSMEDERRAPESSYTMPEALPAPPVTPAEDAVDSRIYRPDATTAQRSSAPVLALLDQARQAGAAGRYPQAQASLERAQRIAPRDPAVYEALARPKIAQGEFVQAEQLGLKGLELGPAPDLRRKLETAVAEARSRK